MDYIHKRQARHFNVMQLAADDEEGWNVLTGDFVVAGSGSDIVFSHSFRQPMTVQSWFNER